MNIASPNVLVGTRGSGADSREKAILALLKQARPPANEVGGSTASRSGRRRVHLHEVVSIL